MTHFLELKNFHYYYGNIHVVKGINLHVEKGEMVTIIGANGAGKTTTMRSISGLTDPAGVRGEIWFKGKKISGLSGSRIMSMGLAQVLEGRHIFSKLSVMENLMIGAYTRKDRGKIKGDLEEIFELFPRLKERIGQMGGTLSGGEQQMLAIGRALIAKPEMLILDEPSLGLAPIIVQDIFQTIKKIKKAGTTILFVEQNSKLALKTAERAYVFQTGNVAIEDSCEELMNNESVKKAYLGV
jgi:branched-chain amino acid transport system ATP-binding protein